MIIDPEDIELLSLAFFFLLRPLPKSPLRVLAGLVFTLFGESEAESEAIEISYVFSLVVFFCLSCLMPKRLLNLLAGFVVASSSESEAESETEEGSLLFSGLLVCLRLRLWMRQLLSLWTGAVEIASTSDSGSESVLLPSRSGILIFFVRRDGKITLVFFREVSTSDSDSVSEDTRRLDSAWTRSFTDSLSGGAGDFGVEERPTTKNSFPIRYSMPESGVSNALDESCSLLERFVSAGCNCGLSLVLGSSERLLAD